MEKLNDLAALDKAITWIEQLPVPTAGAAKHGRALYLLREDLNKTSEAFRELEQRAEAAEAKLAELENNSLIDHLEKCSAIVASWPEWKKQGAHASKFTRPAPKNVSYLVAPGEPSSLWAMGFNACIDTILRNIDEENKK